MRRTPIVIGLILMASIVGARAGDRPMDYQDNDYQFGFQFPQDWKVQRTPISNQYGQVRVLVHDPAKPIYVEAIIGNVGKSITKVQYEANPNHDALVDGLINFTVEQVYKKTSVDEGASKMIVVERTAVPYELGIMFRISTVQVKEGVPFAVFGIHVIPFGKPYLISFLGVMPLNKGAATDNETVTRIFNSFHLLGEKPPS